MVLADELLDQKLKQVHEGPGQRLSSFRGQDRFLKVSVHITVQLSQQTLYKLPKGRCKSFFIFQNELLTKFKRNCFNHELVYLTKIPSCSAEFTGFDFYWARVYLVFAAS